MTSLAERNQVMELVAEAMVVGAHARGSRLCGDIS